MSEIWEGWHWPVSQFTGQPPPDDCRLWVSNAWRYPDSQAVPVEDGVTYRWCGEPIRMCTCGLHASAYPAYAASVGPIATTHITRVRLSGVIFHNEDKSVASERTVLWTLDARPYCRDRIAWCALQLLNHFGEPVRTLTKMFNDYLASNYLDHVLAARIYDVANRYVGATQQYVSACVSVRTVVELCDGRSNRLAGEVHQHHQRVVYDVCGPAPHELLDSRVRELNRTFSEILLRHAPAVLPSPSYTVNLPSCVRE